MLRQADEAFRFQEYDRTIALLEPLVDAGRLKGRRLMQALERLGASAWFLGSTPAARRFFARLLKAEPEHQLDPLYYPTALIQFFEGERGLLKEMGVIGRSTQEPPPPEAPRTKLVERITEHETPWVAYLMPFGVGQFANDDTVTGTLVAVGEGAGLVAMFSTTLAINALETGGKIPREEKGRYELLRGIWWGGAGLFAATWLYSVVDGFIFRRTTPTIIREEKAVEPKPGEPAAPPAEPRPSLRLLPAPGGLALELQF